MNAPQSTVQTPEAKAAYDARWKRVMDCVALQQPDRIDAPGDDPANWMLAAGEPADEATLADILRPENMIAPRLVPLQQ